jgi:hypothetical protein
VKLKEDATQLAEPRRRCSVADRRKQKPLKLLMKGSPELGQLGTTLDSREGGVL